jgi:deoxyribodipyrimidine photo-lyase
MQREKKLQAIAIKHARVFYSTEDCLLHGIGTVRTGAGGCFKVFTPYYNHVVKLPVATPSKNRRTNYLDTRIQGTMTIEQIRDSLDIPASMTPEQFPPTRANAMKRLAGLKQHREYADTRNTMHLPTTRLSPYIKFGLVSVREVYHRIKKLFGVSHDIIRQLYWREFYYDLAWDRPDIFDGNAIKPQYDAIRWKRNAKQLERWKQGLTGCPVVDAGMRELNQTGYMHNRARLITSNYLTKHYFIDWHEGEKYYASKLIDYDPCVNNGNWQFTSGSGADSQPYFRMMNPWLQGARHDADCLYIKKWIPELANVPCEILHRWQDEWAKYPEVNYPRPYKVYDYAKLKKESKAVYARAFE